VRALALLAAAIAAIALGASCGGKVIDDNKAEDAIERDFERNVGIPAISVDCPTDVDVKAGNNFDCVVKTKRGKATVTLKVLNEDADVRVTDFKPGG
jgi:hypothetical protein